MPHLNQHKPLPPDDVLRPLVERYFHLGMSDVAILDHVKDHLDMAVYGISLKSLKRLRVRWNLLGTRQQQHSFQSISPAVGEIRARYPAMGARQMVHTLRQDYRIKASERLIQEFLRATEPEAVKARSKHRFKRKRFWAAGVNDIWTFDQHDKWKRFGLWLHLGLEPFAGRLLWLKVWRSNRQSRLITSYYLEAARKAGGVPLVTQSDLGSENYGIANCHTLIRHRLDPTLANTIQHRWHRDKMNIKAEAAWSQIRRQFTRGFEDILDAGYNSDLYDRDDELEYMVFRWLAIPWLQAELDTWRRRFNSTPRRADRNKVLPCGIPDVITDKPGRYGTVDFKVVVPPELLVEMEKEWADPEDPIFLLVPRAFEAHAIEIYDRIGNPAITSANFWDIYTQVLAAFRFLPRDPQLDACLQEAQDGPDQIELLPGLHDLPHGSGTTGTHGYYYMGGLAQPPALEDGGRLDSDDVDLQEYAYFTSDDDD